MSTQALVTITRGGKVTRKIVSGCNGYNAEKMAKAILDNGVDDPKQLEALAQQCELACGNCLVIQSGPEEFWPEQPEDLLLYTAKFALPEFNPRWENGTAAYTFVVDLDAKTMRRA